MENQSEINLIETEGLSSTVPVEAHLQRLSTVVLITLIVVGIVMGGSALFLRTIGSRLTRTHQALSDSINSQSEKESMFLGIKDRLRLAKLAVDVGATWVNTLITINTIVQPPVLKSISVDLNRNIVLTIELGRMEDAFAILGNTVTEVTKNAIRNPQIVSFQLSKTGGANLVLGFQSAL